MTEIFKITTRPIEGDITASGKTRYNQVSPEEFLAVVDEILATPGIRSIGWTQHTPYFNDGEPCEFGLGELALDLDPAIYGEVDDDDAYALPEEGYNWATSWGIYTYPERGNYSTRKYELNGVDTKPLNDIFSKWASERYENVALDSFGDHAVVVATPEGFSVDYYEHE